jgi:subtilisin family serine protease
MAKRTRNNQNSPKKPNNQNAAPRAAGEHRLSASVDELLAAALERGDENLETGRYIVTFKESAAEEGSRALSAQGMRLADARDFDEQNVTLESVGDAEALVFPEIGAAVISGAAMASRSLGALADGSTDSAIETIEPEYFAFADAAETTVYLRGFRRAVEAISQDLRAPEEEQLAPEEDPLVVGATWGLIACKVPPSVRSGVGIKVALLDTGLDLGHPDFAGRAIVSQTFVGQPVQDLHGHGTHTCGTACGPKAPAGTTPRYGIAYRAPIFIGKVLNNVGSGSTATVLAGMNWAIANRCVAISMSLGAQTPVQAAYTAAGASALSKGCLIIAAAGNSSGLPTGAPANSPTIMAVASLDPTLAPSAFNSVGKIEISGPGRDVFSSWPRPTKYKTISGTSMATPHVAGCAALWAESSPALRGMALWRKLQATAKPLPFPPSKVGKGLVQAP